MDLTDYQQIRELLQLHGFHFSKSMGQNFLTAAWVPEQIADSAGLDEKTGVLEVGPGIGCLTVQLSRRAGKVFSIELDRRLMPVLSQTLAGCENTEVIFGDVMKTDLRELVEKDFAGLRPVVCANLPYNITSPVLTKFIRSGLFETITVMIQREVAHRICAKAGEKDYSAFGILVQWYTEPEILFDVSPSCFVPQPKVSSSVIRLRKRREKPVQVSDEDFLFSVIRAAFNQRRKTLANAVSSGISGISREMAENAIIDCGFDPRIRGEELTVANFAALAEKMRGSGIS